MQSVRQGGTPAVIRNGLLFKGHRLLSLWTYLVCIHVNGSHKVYRHGGGRATPSHRYLKQADVTHDHLAAILLPTKNLPCLTVSCFAQGRMTGFYFPEELRGTINAHVGLANGDLNRQCLFSRATTCMNILYLLDYVGIKTSDQGAVLTTNKGTLIGTFQLTIPTVHAYREPQTTLDVQRS